MTFLISLSARPARRFPLAVLAVVGLAASSSLAQTDIPWLTATNGSWSVNANWTAGNVPNDPTERAVLGLSGTYTVAFDGNFSAYGVQILNPAVTLQLPSARSFTVQGGTGAFVNNGVFIVNPTAAGSGTVLNFAVSAAAEGSGSIVLNSSSNLATAIISTGAGVVLTNALGHTIRGTGQVSGALTNDGLVTADQSGKILRLLTTPKTNNADMTAVGGATLSISGTTVTQGPVGRIIATDAEVELSGATIVGGELLSSGTGLFRVSGSSTLTGVSSSSQTLVESARTLSVMGGLVNDGVITVNLQSGSGTGMFYVDTGALSGSGEVFLNSGGNLDTATLNAATGQTITHGVDHTIRGAGNIYAIVINHGLITADQSGRTLQLLTGAKSSSSLISATNGGTLALTNFTLTQANEAVVLNDASTLSLSGVTIVDGTVRTLGAGLTQLVGSSTFNGVTNEGAMQVNSARTLTILNGVANDGVITVNPEGSGSGTTINFGNSGAFAGEGEVNLSASTNVDTAVISASPKATVTNVASHLIRGTGSITAPLINLGEIRADRDERTLRLSAGAKTNNSLMTAVNGSTLLLSNFTLTQAPAGLIFANGGDVNFIGATVNGGIVDSAPGSVGRLTGSATFSAVENRGGLLVNSATTLTVANGITNSGAITINPQASGSGTNIQFANDGNLAGDGELILAAGTNVDTAVLNSVSAAVVTHDAAHLIRGTGSITAPIVNNGEIRADRTGAVLRLSAGAKTNNDLMTAVNGSTLLISSTTVTQAPGARISAAGGDVELTGATIVGGLVESTGASVVRLVGSSAFNGVRTDGTLLINAATQLTVPAGLVNEADITVNPTAGGSGTGIVFSASGTLSGSGQVILNASSNLATATVGASGAAVLTNAEGHTIAGRGQITGLFVNDGRISPGGPVDSTGFIERVGTYVAGATSSIEIDLDGVVQGTSFDHFRSTGAMTLDGTLTVRLAPGYTPPANTAFTVVSAPTISGIFDTVNLPPLPQALGYARIQYLPNAVRILIPLCTTDWNGMDGINSQDFFDFLNDFFSGTADFNFDGFSNSQDYFDFLTSFFGGCD